MCVCVLHGLHGVCYVCISWWHVQCVLFVWNGMGVYSLHVVRVCVCDCICAVHGVYMWYVVCECYVMAWYVRCVCGMWSEWYVHVVYMWCVVAWWGYGVCELWWHDVCGMWCVWCKEKQKPI